MTIRVAQLGSGYQRKSKSEYVIKQTTVYQGFKVYALQKKKRISSSYAHRMYLPDFLFVLYLCL